MANAWFATLYRSIFPCLRLSKCSFVLLKYDCQRPWVVPHLSGLGPSAALRKRGAHRPAVHHGSGGGALLATRDWRAPPELILSLLFVSKALLHPVLDCVVPSLAAPIPRCQGSIWSLPRGLLTDARCSATLDLITSVWCSTGQEWHTWPSTGEYKAGWWQHSAAFSSLGCFFFYVTFIHWSPQLGKRFYHLLLGYLWASH